MKKLEARYLDVLQAFTQGTMPKDTLSAYVKLSVLLARDLKSLGYRFPKESTKESTKGT